MRVDLPAARRMAASPRVDVLLPCPDATNTPLLQASHTLNYPARTRTSTNRTKTCCATITPPGNGLRGRACRPPCSHLSIHGSRECAGRITRYISEERPRKTVSDGASEPAGQEKRRGCDWALPGARAPGRVPDALRSPPSNRRHRPAPWGRTNLRVLRGSPPGRPGGRTQVGKDSSIHLDCQRCEMGRFQVHGRG